MCEPFRKIYLHHQALYRMLQNLQMLQSYSVVLNRRGGAQTYFLKSRALTDHPILKLFVLIIFSDLPPILPPSSPI